MASQPPQLLFPEEAISLVDGARGPDWQSLVARVRSSDPDSPDLYAFLLMMARLSGCADCQADSYRAMQGCPVCSRQALRRFRGPDADLLLLYDKARTEILEHIPRMEP